MYTGKEVCHGCKKTGKESPRYNKHSLCHDCEKLLKIGKEKEHEDSIEYVSVRQFYYAFSSLEFDDNTFNKLIIDLLNSINNPNAKSQGSASIKSAFADNCSYTIIPVRFLKPLQEFGKFMDEYIRKIKEEKESLPKLAKIEVQKEKDRIYNEGINTGRNLLIQLNKGEITVDEFNTNKSYNL